MTSPCVPRPEPPTVPVPSSSIDASKLTDLEVSGDLSKSEEPGSSGLEVESFWIEVFKSSSEGVGVEGVFDGAEVDGEEDSALGWDLGRGRVKEGVRKKEDASD